MTMQHTSCSSNKVDEERHHGRKIAVTSIVPFWLTVGAAVLSKLKRLIVHGHTREDRLSMFLVNPKRHYHTTL